MRLPDKASVAIRNGAIIASSEGKFYFVEYSETDGSFVSSEIDGTTGKAISHRALAIGKTTNLVDEAVKEKGLRRQ